MEPSLQTAILRNLERQPENHALGFFDSRDRVRWRTWTELYTRAAHQADRLANAGLRPGRVCIISLPSDEACATCLLATVFLGGVPLLVAPPLLQGADSNLLSILTTTIQRTEAAVVVCDDASRDLKVQIEAAREGTAVLFGAGEDATVAGADATLLRRFPAEDDVAAMQLTSGTTGFPRICVWKQGAVLAALRGMASAMRLETGDVCFNWTPLYHDMGLVNNFFLCLTQGIPLVLLNPHEFIKRPATWLRGLYLTDSTLTWSPNFGFALAAARVLDAELDSVRLDRVRAFWNAAERVHLETLHEFYRRFSRYGVSRASLKTNFGCAENVGGATFSDADGFVIHERLDRHALHVDRVARPVPPHADGEATVTIVGVGRPVPGAEVRILAPDGTSLPDGHVGELALLTPSRMIGYLGDPEATREALMDGAVRTGDLAYVRGGEVFWVGRVRERITLRGKKIDPSDFEAPLLKVPGLREGCFAAFGVDDARMGTQRIVLVIEVRTEAHGSLEQLTADIHERISLDLGVEVSEVLLVPAGTLTKTSSGKRRHSLIKERYLQERIQAQCLPIQDATPHGALQR